MYQRPILAPKRPAQRKSDVKVFPAPTSGWISNRNLASPISPEGAQAQGAARLDNFFPTSTTAILRRGKELYATLGTGTGNVTSLFSFVDGLNRKLFASTEDTIFDITNVEIPYNYRIVDTNQDYFVDTNGDYFGRLSTEDLEVFENTTGGMWSTVQFATTGDVYLIGVNGSSVGFLYDGDDFQEYSPTGTPPITFPGGLTTADMSHVWVYRNRLWFVQKDSLNVWYMDASDAVGGAPEIYPMGGIFTKGGSILWGDSWSFESGASGGLSDQMVITSTEGEVAVFQGSYPEAANDWKIVGTYRIGTPLGKRAYFRGGGDIAVATSVGLVPLSKAISLDVNALSPATVSYNIQDAWQNALEERGLADWQCHIWPESKMAVISPPNAIGTFNPVLFISNTETGAWCRYTNWDARTLCVFDGQLYFGGVGGEVFKANETGTDNGEVYTGVYIPLFDSLGTPANKKIPKMGRGKTRSKAKTVESVRFKSDFDIEPGPAPSATPVDGSNTWGSGVWGTAVWGATLPNIISSSWKSIGGMGYYMSMCYQVTSGSMVPLDVEIIDLEMTFTMGEIVT